MNLDALVDQTPLMINPSFPELTWVDLSLSIFDYLCKNLRTGQLESD